MHIHLDPGIRVPVPRLLIEQFVAQVPLADEQLVTVRTSCRG